MSLDPDDIDYADLAERIERFAGEFNALPHVEFEKLRATPEDRKRIRQLQTAADELYGRLDAELPPGWDLVPVSLARRAVFDLGSTCHNAYYKLRGARPQRADPDLAVRSKRLMADAVTAARRLRDHGPDVPRAERLLESVGPKRALELLAGDLREILDVLEQRRVLSEDAHAELRVAATLVALSAKQVR